MKIALNIFVSIAIAFVSIAGCSSGSGSDEGTDQAADTWEKVGYDVVIVDVSWDSGDLKDVPDDPGKDIDHTDDGTGPVDADISPDDKDDGPNGEDVKPDPPADPGDTAEVDTGPCVPKCEFEDGKPMECGPDECGEDICGYCAYGFACKDNLCEIICIPDCYEEGKLCGDDGCGGSCGECGEGFECKDDFKCHYVECTPDCTGKDCGYGNGDGCGDETECGECGAGQSCTEAGHCVVGPCQGVDKEQGACDGDFVLYCNEVGGQEVLIKINCTDEPDKVCGWDPWGAKFACVDKPPCVPDCADKECGNDGCDGTCGTCPIGWGCPGFKCRPVEGASCGWIEETGSCWYDNWLYYCTGPSDTGQIIAEDCTQQGKVCAYDSLYTHSYQCMNPI